MENTEKNLSNSDVIAGKADDLIKSIDEFYEATGKGAKGTINIVGKLKALKVCETRIIELAAKKIDLIKHSDDLKITKYAKQAVSPDENSY